MNKFLIKKNQHTLEIKRTYFFAIYIGQTEEFTTTVTKCKVDSRNYIYY